MDSCAASPGESAVSPDGLAYATGVDLGASTTRTAVVGALRRIGSDCRTWPGRRSASSAARWYHWSGLRGYDRQSFGLANPAPTWKSVGSELSADEFDTWGGATR